VVQSRQRALSSRARQTDHGFLVGFLDVPAEQRQGQWPTRLYLTLTPATLHLPRQLRPPTCACHCQRSSLPPLHVSLTPTSLVRPFSLTLPWSHVKKGWSRWLEQTRQLGCNQPRGVRLDLPRWTAYAATHGSNGTRGSAYLALLPTPASPTARLLSNLLSFVSSSWSRSALHSFPADYQPHVTVAEMEVVPDAEATNDPFTAQQEATRSTDSQPSSPCQSLPFAPAAAVLDVPIVLYVSAIELRIGRRIRRISVSGVEWEGDERQ